MRFWHHFFSNWKNKNKKKTRRSEHTFLFDFCLKKRDDKWNVIVTLCAITRRPYFPLTSECALEKVKYEKYGMLHHRQREGFLYVFKVTFDCIREKVFSWKGILIAVEGWIHFNIKGFHEKTLSFNLFSVDKCLISLA